MDVNKLLKVMHNTTVQTYIFWNTSQYYEYLENNYAKSVETSSLIFSEPEPFITQVVFAMENCIDLNLNDFLFFV